MIVSVIVFIVSVLLAYVIGSFPTSFLLTKMLKGTDIRDEGSRNAGATNVLRVVGKLPALVTLVIDILKGVLVVTIIAKFFYSFEDNLIFDFYRGLLGLTVICGHIWSVFLGFKGGKGVATTLGVAMVLAPKILLPSVIVWLIVFFGTNYVSLASIISFIIFPVMASFFGVSFYTIFFSAIICGIVIYKHKDNIKRLLNGEENKTILFKPS